jgi:hypothetical protein
MHVIENEIKQQQQEGKQVINERIPYMTLLTILIHKKALKKLFFPI